MKERKDRTLGVNITFKTSEQKDAAVRFLNSEGRRPSAFLRYLLEQEMSKSGFLQVVGKNISPELFRRK